MTKTVALPCALLALLFAPELAALEDLATLKAQIQRMQDENEQLRMRLDQQDQLIEELLTKVDGLVGDGQAPDGSRGDDMHGTNGGALPQETVSAMQEPVASTEDPSAPPNLFIKGFADVNYVAVSDREELREPENSFALNELDLLLTSQLSDELSVLSEVVFHFGETDDLSFFEIERIYVKYAPSDLFNIKLGRIHTPIGYWNQTYHHGAWFHTTVERPEIFKFEDDGGILPVHSVGAELLGVQRVGSLEIGYSASVNNGRGETIDTVQNVRDLNRSKALNFRINLAPTEIAGLQFGATTYFDRFPASATPDRPGELEEFIAAGHFTYEREGTEFLAELVSMRHQDELNPEGFDTLGLYVQGAYAIRNWKPYYRFDFQDVDENDPLFRLDHNDVQRHTFGTRWDANTWLALKFEYAYEERSRTTTFHRFATQGAFVF